MSQLPDSPRRDLQQIIEAAERELQGVDHTPFSPKAFGRLKQKISEYTVQLISESVKVAHRHHSESVSTSDVERASQYLVSSTTNKLYKHLGTVGGILLGTAASNMLSMITTNQYTINGIIVTFVLTLLGGGMVAIHIVKE
jgi:histone H3/H4